MGRQLDKSQVGGGAQTEAEINYTPTETGSFRRSRPLRPRLSPGFEITRFPALTRPPASPCEGILRKEAGDPPQRPRGPDSKPGRLCHQGKRDGQTPSAMRRGLPFLAGSIARILHARFSAGKGVKGWVGLGDALILRALPPDTRDSCRITWNNTQCSQVHCLRDGCQGGGVG